MVIILDRYPQMVIMDDNEHLVRQVEPFPRRLPDFPLSTSPAQTRTSTCPRETPGRTIRQKNLNMEGGVQIYLPICGGYVPNKFPNHEYQNQHFGPK